MTAARRRAVFLDRDGTINVEVHFLRRPEELRLLPGAAEGIARLRALGYVPVVVTNQSGVARGYLEQRDLGPIHARLNDLLEATAGPGARVDAFYACPHLPDGIVAAYRRVCACRKPEPGLFLDAAQDLDLDLAGSIAVGDKERDVEAALRAGCGRAFLVGPALPAGPSTRAEAVVPSLAALADLVAASA